MNTIPVPIDALEFRGLIGNKTWDEITGPEFFTALEKCGWREAHNAHIFLRLCQRGPGLGILTPNDFARALRDGYTIPAGDGALERRCRARGGEFAVIYREGAFITFVHR
jgi:hypothetical protein